MNNSEILEQVRRALNFTNSATVTRLTSGSINHVYRITDPVGEVPWTNEYSDVVVKWLGEDRFSGVDRTYQFGLQQQLFLHKVAPKPLWISDDERIWVEVWQNNDTVQPLAPAELAGVLSHIHCLPVTARPLNLATRWQHYSAVCNLSSGDDLYSQVQSLYQAVINSELEKNDLVLCHNDLLSNHVLSQKGGVPMVIDWEYAALGNRYFDLASCSLINQFGEGETIELVEAYCSHMNIAEDEAKEKFSNHSKIVSTTNALWLEALSVSTLNTHTE